MKNLIITTLALFAFTACQKAKTVNPDTKQSLTLEEESNQVLNLSRTSDKLKIKILFKHTETPSTSNPSPPSCGAAGGLCIVFGNSAIASTYVFTSEDRAQAIGTMDMKIIDNGHMQITPDTPFADELTKLLRMTGDMTIDANIANQLGYKSIKILKGNYLVDLNNGPFGSTVVNIISAN